MKPLLYRKAWDAPRDHRTEFAVYSHGLSERMPPGRLRYTRYLDDWLLIYFHDDAGIGRPGGWQTVAAHSLVAWVPGAVREYGREGSEWTHSWVQVAGTRVAGILREAGIVPGVPWNAGSPEGVELGLRQLHDEVTGHVRMSPRIAGNLFENWLLALARKEAPGDVDHRLVKLKRYLDTQTSRAVPLAEMSRIAAVSPSHLSELFRAAFSRSPVAYHILRRMDAARFLLRNRDSAISEVAERVGYPDIYAFSRMFKRVVGVSPRLYRLDSIRKIRSGVDKGFSLRKEGRSSKIDPACRGPKILK